MRICDDVLSSIIRFVFQSRLGSIWILIFFLAVEMACSLAGQSAIAQQAFVTNPLTSTTTNSSDHSNHEFSSGLAPSAVPSSQQDKGLVPQPRTTRQRSLGNGPPKPEGPDWPNQQPYRLTSRFHLEQGTLQGYLIVQIDLKPGAYIYSLTQGGDLNPSKLLVSPSPDFQIMGDFLSDSQPEVIVNDPIFGQRVEKHRQTVQFFAPIKFRIDPSENQIEPVTTFEGQVCTEDGTCIPLKGQVVRAEFGGYFHRAAARDNYSVDR
jgi:hypothetical protein